MSCNANDFKPAGSVSILLLSVVIVLITNFPCKAEMPGEYYTAYIAGQRVALATACKTPKEKVNELLFYIVCDNANSKHPQENKSDYIGGFFSGAMQKISSPKSEECKENEAFIDAFNRKSAFINANANSTCFYKK